MSGTTITSAKNIVKDNYYVSISGSKTGSVTGIDYSVSGTVGDAGTNPSTLSLTLSDVKSGHITVEVIEGSASRFSQTFTISTFTPPNENTGGGGDTGGGGAPAAGQPEAAPPSLLAPPGISATTATLMHNTQGQILADYVIETDPAAGFESAVEIGTGTTVISGTGQPVGEISITPLDPESVNTAAITQTGVFSFSGYSIECEPSGTQFSGGTATVSFTLTAAQWAAALAEVDGNLAAMTIQTYDPVSQTWIEVPTVINPVTHTVSAQVTHFSTYALFYKTESNTVGDLAQYTQVSTPAPAATTPAKTMLAPTETPQKSGGILDDIFNWFTGLFGSE
jgi:hypothetical protein